MKTQQWVPQQTASTMNAWQTKIRYIIDSSSPSKKAVLVGMGHPLRSDDYAGSYIVKRIIVHSRDEFDDVLLFDGEDNVENLITTIAQLQPQDVIFIDACEMKARPGETSLIPVGKTEFPFFTTHGVPLKLLADQVLTRSNVWLLAIQPENTDFGEQLSTTIRVVADSIAAFFVKLLKERSGRVDS